MLHTIVPQDQIFASEYSPPSAAQYGGALAEIQVDPYGRPGLGRLYTTDLKAYLSLSQLKIQ